MTAASVVRLGGLSRTLVLVGDLTAGRVRDGLFEPRQGFSDAPLSAEDLRAIADLLDPVTAADQPTTEPTTITVPRPHVPHGPEHVTPAQGDAAYLRGAVLNIEHQHRGERLWGSGGTAMVSKLLNDAADALVVPAPQPAADTERPVDVTPRGFGIWSEFTDRYGQKVTVVESSLATEACVWVAPADGQNIHLNEPQATELRNALSAWLLALDETQETNA